VVQPLLAPRWEGGFVVVATVIFTTNVIEISLTFGPPGPSYPPQVRLTFLLIYGVAGLLLLRARQPLPTLVATAPMLWVVLAMPLLSVLWSVDPSESLERAVAVTGTSLFAAYLGWRFTLGRILFLLAIAMTIAVGLSLIAIVALPSIGVTQSGQWAGTWKGIHFHKNGLGTAASLACLVIGYAVSDSRGLWRAAFCGAFLAALALLVGSQSTSSLLAMLVIGVLALWARLLQTMPRETPVLSAIIGIGVVIAAVQLMGADFVESALAALHKRSDLSSRVPLWGIVWVFIAERFWFGYGFEAFWKLDSSNMRSIEAQLHFVPFYSHNGLLETWLNGGLVLVILAFCLLTLTIVRSAILLARWRRFSPSAFPLIYCCHFIMMNFAESSVLARNNMVWVLLVTIAAFTSKWVRLRTA
jgi:O-antigen ligase